VTVVTAKLISLGNALVLLLNA
jgi:hypothetical protein